MKFKVELFIISGVHGIDPWIFNKKCTKAVELANLLTFGREASYRDERREGMEYFFIFNIVNYSVVLILW